MSLSILPPVTGWPVTSRAPNLRGTTLPQVLKPLGYRCAFVGSGDNTYLNQSNFLANRGFDDVIDAHTIEAMFGCKKLFSWGVEDHYTIDALIQWIDREPAHTHPFYALTWTQQTHHPYELAPGRPQVDYLRGQPHPAARDYNRYLNCLHETDAQVGRLLDALAARHLADDTLLIVTGDHGEAFGTPHDVWGHGSAVYDENLRVPLIVSNPRLFPQPRRMPQVGGQIDLNATVLDLLGVNLPLPGDWQGWSLFDPARPDRTYGLSVNGDALLCVREGPWKYVYNASLGRETLFDLTIDLNEQRDAAFEHRALCDDLRQRLAARIATGVRQYH
jgi:arylsulfatase A-like enzyme